VTQKLLNFNTSADSFTHQWLRSIRAEVRLDKVNAVINNCNKYQVNVQHIFHCIQLFVRMSFHRLHLLLSKKTARKMKRLPLIAAVIHFKINTIIKIIHTHTPTKPYYSAEMLIFPMKYIYSSIKCVCNDG